MSYVELHCHSNFSFLQGASHPEELIDRAHKLGYSALALTDQNGLYGIVRFNQAAQKAGVHPIFGAEAVLENGTNLVLLVKNQVGYTNLSQMLSSAQLNGKKCKATVSEELLTQHADGLIALSGDILNEPLLRSELPQARKIATRYAALFGAGNFYLELQHHNLPVHEVLCRKLTLVGKTLSIPTIATNNVYYATPGGRKMQDVLTCIKNHVTLDEAHDLLYPNAERYLKPPDLAIQQFSKYPEAIENTLVVASRCRFELGRLQTSLPDFPLPPDESSFSYLKDLTYDGARRRYGHLSQAVKRQLEHELSIIERLNLSGYFLIVWDIARFCRANGILCQGRGSAANSAVCYCLEVTAVDPIKLGLLFERFLSEERTEPPDIDIDIAHNRREEAIQYVYEKYGREHAAMVCEVITYRGRSAVRDVGKALGFSLHEVDRLAKSMDHYSDSTDLTERVNEAKLNLDGRRVRLLVKLVQQIQGFPRHLGIHVGGMVITKAPLSQVVPVENATMPDRSIIQWDKDDAGEVGLVKIDLLGLGMLSLIDIAFKLIQEHHGVTVDMAKLSFDDPQVYDLLCSADTVGVFQVESRAQMNALPRHKPRRFYDLVIEVALIRPGPIQGDMVHPYLRRRNGEEAITYPHPVLKPILERTLGVPLFQEQGMRVAMAAAGFSPSEADELRRAMGHKRSAEKMQALQARLIAGMIGNGIEEEYALKIFRQLAAFADFGFAESHAASFALLVYVSAFLKVHYPREFYCALLNAQPLGFYSPSTIIYEARRRGIKVFSVDVSKSAWDCMIEDDGVRLGFRYVKSMGPAAKEKIEVALKKGPFTSPADFVFRTKLDQDCLEQLALVGAFCCFGLTCRQALWEILSLVRQTPEQLPMESDECGRRLLEPMAVSERLMADFKGMGLSTGPHPMQLVREALARQQILSSADLRHVQDKETVRVAGIVIIRQRPATARGFLFITLEDETGFANIVVKPYYVQKCRRAIIYSRGLVVKGQVERKDGVVNVIGKEFTPLRIAEDDVVLKSRDFR